jgi:hypothetical protein
MCQVFCYGSNAQYDIDKLYCIDLRFINKDSEEECCILVSSESSICSFSYDGGFRSVINYELFPW